MLGYFGAYLINSAINLHSQDGMIWETYGTYVEFKNHDCIDSIPFNSKTHTWSRAVSIYVSSLFALSRFSISPSLIIHNTLLQELERTKSLWGDFYTDWLFSCNLLRHLSDLESSSLYQIKDIGKIYLGNQGRNINNNKQIAKSYVNLNLLTLTLEKHFYYYFIVLYSAHWNLQSVKNLEWCSS